MCRQIFILTGDFLQIFCTGILNKLGEAGALCVNDITSVINSVYGGQDETSLSVNIHL